MKVHEDKDQLIRLLYSYGAHAYKQPGRYPKTSGL